MRLHPVFTVVTAAGLVLGSVAACGGRGAEAPAAAPSVEAPAAAPSAEAPAAASASAAPSAAAPTPSAEAVVGPPEVAWKDMTKAQHGKFMKAVVLPKMKEVLTAFDPKEFAEVNCATCHGKGAADGSFKMPNPELPVLPADTAGFNALMKKEPKWMKFMMEKVKPTMADLLKIPEFDPAHPKPDTFACHNCHTTKEH